MTAMTDERAPLSATAAAARRARLHAALRAFGNGSPHRQPTVTMGAFVAVTVPLNAWYARPEGPAAEQVVGWLTVREADGHGRWFDTVYAAVMDAENGVVEPAEPSAAAALGGHAMGEPLIGVYPTSVVPSADEIARHYPSGPAGPGLSTGGGPA